MNAKINPFHELYFGESVGPDSFVKIFSDVLVDHSLSLFKPGNVVLKGLPGSGKSMMLSLLKPSVRIAYERNNIAFPVPKEFSNFIGASVNLIRSSVSDFGQRPINNSSDNLNELAVYFGDFLNYLIVKDIISSVQELGKYAKGIDIDLDPDKLDLFALSLKKDDAWFGYLDNVNSFNELNEAIKSRIVSYRSYLSFNGDDISNRISTTKTSIGIPVTATAKNLRDAGVIGKDVNIFVTIDQYEELSWLDDSIEGLSQKYQSVVHKLLAMRDITVSYRIGTRPFAWIDTDHSIFGSTAKLESLRNYNTVSIDLVLRRPENTKTYIFPKFAEDIFKRRLIESGYKVRKVKSLLGQVLGNGLDPSIKAMKYVTNSRENILELDDKWPIEWKNFLIDLARVNPLSAKLGEAWSRQKGKENIVNSIPTSGPYPWEAKMYWKKERIEQALIQIASKNRQQLVWEGKDDVISLSGGNILAFLSICQQIWEVWMRGDRVNDEVYSLPKLDEVIQTLGILEASTKWFEVISSYKNGGPRKAFINFIGNRFYKNLTQDLKMSYPGQNGFSLSVSDLSQLPEIYKFLKDASDYGDLQERQHTTKLKSAESRVKWYLNPILSPRFKIPAIHTKEPEYISINALISWMGESNITLKKEIPFDITSKGLDKIRKKNTINPNQQNIEFND